MLRPTRFFKALVPVSNRATGLVPVLILCTQWSLAGPVMPAGDSILRHDIQVLADHGIVTGPVTSWPLAWGPILAQIQAVDLSDQPSSKVAASLARIRARAQWETRTHEIMYSAHTSVAESPMRIRSFENSPRESAEVGGGLSFTGDRFSAMLRGQAVDQSSGSGEVRTDGSMLGIAIGNYLLSANTLDRWWGPGWDGSIILSNNARPIPAISIDRNFTDAFQNKWLRWIGPWDVSIMMGQLEGLRHIPHAQFFGMRFNFKPMPSLEIGLSRTAQWCGDGRPCDASTFGDLLLGQDNLGDAGIDADNEPGNQLAGADIRWSQNFLGLSTAFYGQFIGEDEAGGFPSRYLGQFGVETSGFWHESWSWRWFNELAITSCNFYESGGNFNCAYNHSIYLTGYRYRGRSIGHGSDNDARLFSSGISLVNADESLWRAVIRIGQLNRGGLADVRNTVTPVPEDIFSIDLSHRRMLQYGIVDIGIGYERSDMQLTGSSDDTRFYLHWRSAY